MNELITLSDSCILFDNSTYIKFYLFVYFQKIKIYTYIQFFQVNNQSYTRSLKYKINIQVLPSLRINAFTRKSSSRLNEFILGIEVIL